MPQLTEQRRQQLDSIVSQMEANKETEDDIRFVVEDFKKKYSAEIPPLQTQPQTDMRSGPQMAKDLSYEFLKGIPQAVTAIPGGVYAALTGNARALVEGATQLPVTAARNAIALGSQLPGIQRRPFEYLTQKLGTPTREETEQAAQGGGATLAGTVLGEVVPKVAPKIPGVKYIQERAAYAQDRPFLLKTAEGHLQSGLKPDLTPDQLKVATADLKAGEAKIGKPVKDIDLAREAASAQFEKELYPERRAIIDPQKDVVAPGSRKALIDAQIADIPEAIRLKDPALYRQLVAEAQQDFAGGDLTIGELEKLNTSLNPMNRSFHQASTTRAMTQLETVKGSQNVALERASRRIMQDAMDKYGTGGAGMLRNINGRIGNLLKIEDAIDAAEKTARTEAVQPMVGRLFQETGQAIGGTLRRKIPGTTAFTVNEEIAAAMRKATANPPRFSRLPQTPMLNAPPSTANLGSYVRGVPAAPPAGLLGTGTGTRVTAFPIQGPFQMPAPVRALLPEEAGPARYSQPALPPGQYNMSAAPLTRLAGQNLGAFGEAFKKASQEAMVKQAVDARLAQFKDLVQGGATEMTGKALRNEMGEVVRRGGGGMKIMFPELRNIPESPGEIAAAIEKGKGKLYERVVKAVREAMPETFEQPSEPSFGFGANPGGARANALDILRQRLQR